LVRPDGSSRHCCFICGTMSLSPFASCRCKGTSAAAERTHCKPPKPSARASVQGSTPSMNSTST
jgi:hypothetical protein